MHYCQMLHAFKRSRRGRHAHTNHQRTLINPHTPPTLDRYLQLWLFDPAGFTSPARRDPFAGWELTDIRALALDPDPQIRIAATASRWNWDVRVQAVLSTDPNQRVVLALLDQVDPDIGVCQLIIAGPHIAARCELARRNLNADLLELLASDGDPQVRSTAEQTIIRQSTLRTGPR